MPFKPLRLYFEQAQPEAVPLQPPLQQVVKVERETKLSVRRDPGGWKRIILEGDPAPPAPHASTHYADGADPITGWISPSHIGPKSDTVAYTYFRTYNIAGDKIVDHVFAPEVPDHGDLGASGRRWRNIYANSLDLSKNLTAVGGSFSGRVTAGGLTTTSDLTLWAAVLPTAEGQLTYYWGDSRLKFHDGTAVRTIGWEDPSNLISMVVEGRAVVLVTDGASRIIICYPDNYADLSIKQIGGFGRYYPRSPWGRASDINNGYFLNISTGSTTADFELHKIVAGTDTVLGTEAVDLISNYYYTLKLRCSGSTIEGYRTDMTTPKISVADTSFSSGYWGSEQDDLYGTITPRAHQFLTTIIASPTLPPPQPLAYFEVPIIGDGSIENPFRPAMPLETFEFETPNKKLYNSLKAKGFTDEEIFKFFGLTRDFIGNRLAMSYNALIPTDRKTGKPIHGTAIVRIFPQPDRNPNLHPISKCVQTLKSMSGVRELKREEAIRLALKMDDKLHIHDLIPCTKHELGEKCYKEYVKWRESVIGEEPKFAETELRKQYVKEFKGW
jgi:hypothetical protein